MLPYPFNGPLWLNQLYSTLIGALVGLFICECLIRRYDPNVLENGRFCTHCRVLLLALGTTGGVVIMDWYLGRYTTMTCYGAAFVAIITIEIGTTVFAAQAHSLLHTSDSPYANAAHLALLDDFCYRLASMPCFLRQHSTTPATLQAEFEILDAQFKQLGLLERQLNGERWDKVKGLWGRWRQDCAGWKECEGPLSEGGEGDGMRAGSERRGGGA